MRPQTAVSKTRSSGRRYGDGLGDSFSLGPEEIRDAQSLVSTMIDHSIDARECPGIGDLQPDAATSRDVEPWGVFEDRDFLGFAPSLLHFLP